MAVVYIQSFTDELPESTLEIKYENEVNAWMRDCLRHQVCLVCGEQVFQRKNFIWWRADKDIILCCDCAEHTLNGLNRDLAELKGDKSAIGKPGDGYNPTFLKTETMRLQNKVQEYLKRIVDLQNILSRPS